MPKLIVIALIAVLLSSCENDTSDKQTPHVDTAITLDQVRNSWILDFQHSSDINEFDSLQSKTFPFAEIFWDSTKPIIRMMFQLGYCVTIKNIPFSAHPGGFLDTYHIVWMIGESDSTIRVISCNSEDRVFVDTLIDSDAGFFNELLLEPSYTYTGYSSVSNIDVCFLSIWNNYKIRTFKFICFSDFWYLDDMQSLLRLDLRYQYYFIFSTLRNIGIGKQPPNRYGKMDYVNNTYYALPLE